MMHRISSIKIEQYPILEVTFSDGVHGEVDLSSETQIVRQWAEEHRSKKHAAE